MVLILYLSTPVTVMHFFYNSLCSLSQRWCKGSKPVTGHFLDIELEAQIGEFGFQVCNSLIQLVSGRDAYFIFLEHSLICKIHSYK